MVRVERIEFKIVKNAVLDIFPIASFEGWELIPDSIHQLAATQGTELAWIDTPNLSAHADGLVVLDESEFLKLAFYKHKPQGRLYVVTHNCFNKREAYGLDSRDLLEFAKNIDELENEVPFVQPTDYVFVNPEQKLITLIHHEGQVVQYRRWI